MLLVQLLTEAGHYGILEVLSEESENGLRLPAMVRSGKVDAIMVLGQLNREYLKTLSQCSIPLVFLDFYDDSIQIDAVIDQLAEAGVFVPEDVSVVGFDDYTINGSHIPALSTFRISQEDMFSACV